MYQNLRCRNKLKITSILMLCILNSGCLGKDAIFRDRGGDYLKSTLDKDLVVPPSVKELKTSDKYTIPQAQSNGREDIEMPLPSFVEQDKVSDTRLDKKSSDEKKAKIKQKTSKAKKAT